MTRKSPVKSVAACSVCLSTNSLIANCASKKLRASQVTVPEKLLEWATDRLKKHENQQLKAFVDLTTLPSGFRLCRSCSTLVTKIDRLEVELRRNWTSLWDLIEHSRSSENLTTETGETKASTPIGSPGKSPTRYRAKPTSAAELLKIAVKEIFDDSGGFDCDLGSEYEEAGPGVIGDQDGNDVADLNGVGSLRRSARLNSPSIKRRRNAAGSAGCESPLKLRKVGDDSVEPKSENVISFMKGEEYASPNLCGTNEQDGADPSGNLCPVCLGFFPNEEEIRRHIAAVHGKDDSIRCDLCSLHFKSSELLESHRRETHKILEPALSFPCQFCGEVFDSKKRLNVHKRRHEGVICPICGKYFLQDHANANAVRDHIAAIHKGEKNYRCEICGDTFGYQRNLAKHRRQTHGINKDKAPTHSCEECGKVLWERGALIQHVFYVHGKVIDEARMTKCEYCDKDFVCGWRFTRHVAAHRKEKPHACPDCNYRTPDFTKLRLHMRDAHKRNVKRVYRDGFERLPTNYTLVDVDENGEIISAAASA